MILFRPGMQIKDLEIYRKKQTTDAKGRVTYIDELERIGYLQGSISQASQKEIERWHRQEHPITHTIVTRFRTIAKAEDIIKTCDGRKFYIQGKDDPGELGIYSVLYCQERSGV